MLISELKQNSLVSQLDCRQTMIGKFVKYGSFTKVFLLMFDVDFLLLTSFASKSF